MFKSQLLAFEIGSICLKYCCSRSIRMEAQVQYPLDWHSISGSRSFSHQLGVISSITIPCMDISKCFIFFTLNFGYVQLKC